MPFGPCFEEKLDSSTCDPDGTASRTHHAPSAWFADSKSPPLLVMADSSGSNTRNSTRLHSSHPTSSYGTNGTPHPQRPLHHSLLLPQETKLSIYASICNCDEKLSTLHCTSTIGCYSCHRYPQSHSAYFCLPASVYCTLPATNSIISHHL